ncbi:MULTISPECIES: hypothetical protein [unclassified Halobacteriovorax]|uniref:hypothetical protein n=1 Tax=unclassified Halobacteriovorax TaxID=2639665 RepID=UPI00399AFE68
MRGTFFLKPLELNLELAGESWPQGDQINGELTIKAHGEADLSKIGIHLCEVNIKKFKAKDEAAFKVIETVKASGEQTSFSFKLAENCLITEKATSLYVICGDIDTPFECGHLQLDILPNKNILSFIEIFENFLKFKFKPLKNKAGMIQAKITPPDIKDWTSIQTMNLGMSCIDNILSLDFAFKVKKMSYEGGAVETKEVKINNKVEFKPKDYILFESTLNQDFITGELNKVLDEVRFKPVI